MNKNFIKNLICPVCKKGLKVEKSLLAKKDKYIHAILSCGCSKYPLFYGILFMNKDGKTERILRLISRKKAENEEVPIFILQRNLPLGMHVFRFFSRFNLFKHLSFKEYLFLMRILGAINEDWYRYLISRFTRNDFYPAKVLSSLVKRNTGVLDLGCGAGQLISILGKKTSSQKICGVDFNIASLYMARKYYAKNSNLIYYDLNKKLPFKDNVFSYIFASDSIHYIKNKKGLGGELKRIIRTSGLIILTNIHNRKFAGTFSDALDYSESIRSYISYFRGFYYSLLSQEAGKRLSLVNPKKLTVFEKGAKMFSVVFYKSHKFSNIFHKPNLSISKE